MFRCFFSYVAAGLLCVLPPVVQAQYVGPVSVSRHFSANVLRGEIVFALPPEVQLNENHTRTAPGLRIRNAQNMLVMSQTLIGQKFLVHYALEEATGLIKDIWILSPTEAAREPWPRTPTEARNWQFDTTSQRWVRP
ncbi:MAG: hypothetical protein ACK53K_10465 [Burkholderiales bacterium]|jgi:hypothetical protein